MKTPLAQKIIPTENEHRSVNNHTQEQNQLNVEKFCLLVLPLFSRGSQRGYT